LDCEDLHTKRWWLPGAVNVADGYAAARQVSSAGCGASGAQLHTGEAR